MGLHLSALMSRRAEHGSRARCQSWNSTPTHTPGPGDGWGCPCAVQGLRGRSSSGRSCPSWKSRGSAVRAARSGRGIRLWGISALPSPGCCFWDVKEAQFLGGAVARGGSPDENRTPFSSAGPAGGIRCVPASAAGSAGGNRGVSGIAAPAAPTAERSRAQPEPARSSSLPGPAPGVPGMGKGLVWGQSTRLRGESGAVPPSALVSHLRVLYRPQSLPGWAPTRIEAVPLCCGTSVLVIPSPRTGFLLGHIRPGSGAVEPALHHIPAARFPPTRCRGAAAGPFLSPTWSQRTSPG